MSDYTLVNRDDPSIEVFRGAFHKMRVALGTTAFGLNEVTMPPGFEGPEHDEDVTGHEEVYIVLAGSGVVTIDGEAVPVRVGDYLRVGVSVTRKVAAGTEGLTFIAIGAQPKAAFDGRASL